MNRRNGSLERRGAPAAMKKVTVELIKHPEADGWSVSSHELRMLNTGSDIPQALRNLANSIEEKGTQHIEGQIPDLLEVAG